jgi:hypothetical protein
MVHINFMSYGIPNILHKISNWKANLSVPSSGINFSGLEEMHNNCGKVMPTGTKIRGLYFYRCTEHFP